MLWSISSSLTNNIHSIPIQARIEGILLVSIDKCDDVFRSTN